MEPRDMAVVRRIFEMIGGNEESIYGAARVLERAGIPSPKGNRAWAKPTIKSILLDDAYRLWITGRCSTWYRKGI